jgi:hypothetical protein
MLDARIAGSIMFQLRSLVPLGEDNRLLRILEVIESHPVCRIQLVALEYEHQGDRRHELDMNMHQGSLGFRAALPERAK